MIKIKKFVVNPLQENSFVIYDESGECIFIDPGFYYEEEHDEIREFVKEKGLKPVKIVNTHCHFDHIMGVEWLRKEFNIPFFAHPDDEFWIERAVAQGEMFGFEMKPVNKVDGLISESEKIQFGNSELQAIHVPGHSPGHVVLFHQNSKQLIAGDVLFYGSIGRTDLPGGNYQTLISGIKNKVLTLPPDTKVYCGHGSETTIDFEKANNPFLT
jgi:glyoxylase-like metal-dependent hydrolase (beta-lactamase superfamily II)